MYNKFKRISFINLGVLFLMTKKITITIILIFLLIFSSCGRTNNVKNKNFTIVTSFYPIYISTINVTKDIPNVTVINMTKPQTGCLHDYQLTTADLKTLEKANAFVINGAGMEAFLDKVIKQQNLKIVESSIGIKLIKDKSGIDNPHVWVSISNDILQVRNIANQLSEIDKNNQAKYKSNADAYILKLEALREKMHKSLDVIKTRYIITFHEAFPYFAKEFNFNIVSVIEREPGTNPTPKELEETIKIVKNSNVKVLFAEPQYQAKAAQTIAKETGAKIYDLDPVVTGQANINSFNDYIEIMEENLKSLQEALV